MAALAAAASFARRAHWPTAVAFSLVAGYVTVFVLAMVHTGYDTWGRCWCCPR